MFSFLNLKKWAIFGAKNRLKYFNEIIMVTIKRLAGYPVI
jgi:hypothetical protein